MAYIASKFSIRTHTRSIFMTNLLTHGSSSQASTLPLTSKRFHSTPSNYVHTHLRHSGRFRLFRERRTSTPSQMSWTTPVSTTRELHRRTGDMDIRNPRRIPRLWTGISKSRQSVELNMPRRLSLSSNLWIPLSSCRIHLDGDSQTYFDSNDNKSDAHAVRT